MKSHSDINQKFCHYYNNGKFCPFEKLGCKFKHETSPNCVYLRRCKNTLCQFKHDYIGTNKEENSDKASHGEKSAGLWKCEELNFMDEQCAFYSTVKLRYKNHMKANHDIGNKYSCDDCEFEEENRKELIKHIEIKTNKKYLTCDGNCMDRLYEENSFTCGKCKDYACTTCGKANTNLNKDMDPKIPYCYGCV